VAFDIANAQLAKTADLSAEFTTVGIGGFDVLGDKSKLYAVERVVDQEDRGTGLYDGTSVYIRQYSFGTAGEVDTLSYDSVEVDIRADIDAHLSGDPLEIRSLFVKPDGAKLYVLVGDSDFVLQYTLSTPGDLSTLSKDGIMDFGPAWPRALQSLALGDSGGVIYVDTDEIVYAVSLSTAWDIVQTALIDDSFDHGISGEDSAAAFAWRDDGGRFYTGSSDLDEATDFDQYDPGGAWALTSPTVTGTFDFKAHHSHAQEIRLDSVETLWAAAGTELYQYTAAHAARIPLRLGSAHSAPVPLRLQAGHAAAVRQRAARGHTAPAALLQRHAAGHTAPVALEPFTAVAAAHAAGLPLRVAAGHSAPAALRALRQVAHAAVFDLRIDVAAAHGASAPLLDHTPVRSAHSAVFSLLAAPRTHLAMDVTLTAGGRTLPVIAWDIGADEGGYLYEGTVDVGAAGYAALAVDDDVVLSLFGETYNLKVESRSRERTGPAGRRYEIGLRSPSIRHDFPRATPLTKTFSTSVLARDAVEQLLDEAVTWELVDWRIPAFRLAWEEASPIEAAQQIVQAAGGTLQTDPDGTLRARHLYPTSPPDYAATAPARTVDDADDVVTSSESFAPRRLVDRLTIRDTVQGIFSDRLEYAADEYDDRAGTLHVYPSPWRTNLVVTHTSNAALDLTQVGEVTRDEEEVVEFAAGTATLSYPIEALLDVEWLYVSLGGLTFEAFASELQAADADGYSLARITYRTRSIDYRVASPTVDQAQLLLEEVA